MKQVIKQLASLGLLGDINAAFKYDFRARIRRLGREGKIGTVYDIGAHHGNWSRGMKKLLPKANFFLFEANPNCQPFLHKSGFPFALQGLSDKRGKRIFYANDSTGDSFYRENDRISGVSGFRAKEMETIDLDSCVTEHGFPQPDWIKLDVQGSELDVLKGGSVVFSRTRYLLCEIPVMRYNLGAPCFSEYLDSFAHAGFYPISVVENHFLHQPKASPTLCQMDLFFERSENPKS